MRNRLSYYSVLLLVGLAVVSALLFTMNPFNRTPASPSSSGQSLATAASSGNVPATSTPAGVGNSGSLQPGGSFDGVRHHHSNGFPGDEGAGNATTTTTTTANVYSQNE